MKKIIIMLSCFILISSIVSEERIILTDQNTYGGRTIKYVLSPQDKYGDQIKNMYYFYDNKEIITEVLYEFNESKANDFGFKNQREIYRNGIISEYKLEVTDKEKKIKGISWQIERVDSQGNIYEYEYSDGVNTAKSNPQSFVINYPFYSLPYLEEVLFEDYEENKNGDVYTFSMVYWKARTFIEFVSDPVIVNESDKNKVNIYLSHLNQQQYTENYSHKVNIKYFNKQYTCYLQSNFVKYIKKNDKCLLTYQLMGINKDLIILATEFNEIE